MLSAVSFILAAKLASPAKASEDVFSLPQAPGDNAVVLDSAPVSFGYVKDHRLQNCRDAHKPQLPVCYT
jgi:hypothetical protein